MFERVTSHQGHEISRRVPGFEFTPVLLGKISSYLVIAPQGGAGVFAFMYRFAALKQESEPDEAVLAEAAVEVIRSAIDAREVIGNRDRTFEHIDGDWTEVEHPAWWIPTFR